MKKAHHATAHAGIVRTTLFAMKRVWFPGMQKMAQAVLARCAACQEARPRAADQRHTLYTTTPGYPSQRLSLDFVGPLPTSTRGNRYILTVMDTFTC